ncbi:hypothetical protein [Terracoccus luteus]|uniref:Uncharacterized protein n=1 Tax=Terracoccus luteus TaxID=53356 RepID=A0A839PWY8_9MICO|nr:hypothetical protein [Terracoccus luteus]MBB2987603.1 hypothetical protein [Terracoccus luteus]MCP2173254.1 hypothetical protein [Terracoccus luteus]
MDLFKIQHELIADRTSGAWYRINIAGPFFHYRWTWGDGPDGGFSHVIGEHRSYAVCREEPSLTMAWGMDIHDREERRDMHFDWAKKFVNPSVRLFWVDFFWNNALIDRVELCSIDGGHGTIPVPTHDLQVTRFEEAAAFLVHDLDGGPNHDNPGRYLDGLGVTRISDEDRWGAGHA